jgi:UDP-glucose:(heptosyl)LPS alpha-1,3-glucosyltransferase
MKIALVVHDLQDQPGHSLYAKTLANGLSQANQVTVFANRCERAVEARWQMRHVRASRRSAQACVQSFPLGMRAHAPALTAYDIQHSQGYCGGNPNVVTAHICVAAYLDSLRSVSLRHRLSLQLMAAAEKRFYRRYSGRVIAVSQKVAGELQKYYGVQNPIDVIPHGVDAAQFQNGNRERYRADVRRQLSIQKDQTLALYVGDLTKSHSYLKELTVAAPQTQFAVVTGSRAYHWSAANLRIIPSTSEIAKYYAAADAFVFPTTYDAFGLVVLEAMAAGLAVLSSNRAGAAEVIDSGRDGFVAPLSEWVESTATLLKYPLLLQATGIAARQTALRHDWSSVVKAVEQVYKEVAAK